MSALSGVRFWLAAWIASAAIWMVLTDSIRPSEMLTGAGVAALAATAFEVVRRERVAAQSMRPELSVRALAMFPRIVPDVWRLTRAAFAQVVERKPVRGQVIAMPFGHGGDDPDERALRAVASAFGSIAPNTIVIGVDPESGMLLAHQLEPTGKRSDLDPMRLR